MADRTSAGVFGLIFEELAKGDIDPKKLAKKLMKATREFDFNACQMECDKALLKLEVAKMSADDPDDARMLYLYEDYGR